MPRRFRTMRVSLGIRYVLIIVIIIIILVVLVIGTTKLLSLLLLLLLLILLWLYCRSCYDDYYHNHYYYLSLLSCVLHYVICIAYGGASPWFPGPGFFSHTHTHTHTRFFPGVFPGATAQDLHIITKLLMGTCKKVPLLIHGVSGANHCSAGNEENHHGMVEVKGSGQNERGRRDASNAASPAKSDKRNPSIQKNSAYEHSLKDERWVSKGALPPGPHHPLRDVMYYVFFTMHAYCLHSYALLLPLLYLLSLFPLFFFF